ncbi:MAG TPA: serine/threonine-protein kinase [Kofleriaceae bacterium]|nr:serine/threonine-protein kinase [Kofleriaceae bacterium]
MGAELDSTQRSFPPYAELTQTQAWAAKAARVRAETSEVEQAVEVSHGSRYAEGAELGRGGMGKVVLAHDARVGRDVAVKVLHPERELEPDERSRFLREAQVQGQLEHPSIVPVYDIDRRPDGTTFFTMRRVLGRTLAAILDDLRKGVPASKARYTQRELLTAFSTVCLAIDYAHSRGVVHRDLKPANIMLGDFGEVYVLDWGLARLVDEKGESSDHPGDRLSLPGSFLGTPLYMAPEQMAEPDVGPVADVYSLGLILYELLTLERCRDPNAVFAPVDARASVRAPHRNVAPELEAICVRATDLDMDKRYPTPRAMQEAINRFLEGDRELEQRRLLAAAHAKTAREALEASTKAVDPERDRTHAIQELVRALALDPRDNTTVAMLGELLATPPRTIPAEVHEQLRRETQRVIKSGASHSVGAMLSWFLFLPVLMWVGINDYKPLVWVLIPAAGSAIASFIGMRQKHVTRPTQYATIGFMMIASVGIARLYGPLILMPTMVIAYAIVLQAHPARTFRRVGAIFAIITILMPIVFELTGIFPTSYSFADGRWSILPLTLAMPKLGTFVTLTAANIGSLVVPCMFIARLRAELSDIQQNQLLTAWHFRRLGSDLVGAAAQR